MLQTQFNIHNAGGAVSVVDLQECACSLISEVATLLKPGSNFTETFRKTAEVLNIPGIAEFFRFQHR